jgi:hypothetical protein
MKEGRKASFSYDEQILVESTTKTATTLRIESESRWDASSIFHPFGHLETLFLFDAQEKGDMLEMTMQVSSSANQRFPAENSLLSVLPLLADSSAVLSGPSGFWLSIKTSSSSPHMLMEKIKRYVHLWVQKGLIVTPLLAEDFESSWDIIPQNDTNTTYQLFLPSNGAAWSADALKQAFLASLGCQTEYFMGYSATEWSDLFVNGEAWNKQMWWKLSSLKQERQVSFGLQYEHPQSKANSFLSSIENQSRKSDKCLLGTRLLNYVVPGSDGRNKSRIPSYQLLPTLPDKEMHGENHLSINPLITVDLVVRRQWPQRGRIETWIAAEPFSDCSLEVRQVLPSILSPSWQTLRLTSADDGKALDRLPSVEWKDNGSSVVTFSSPFVPSSLLLSLDYRPKFLTYNDFPGDPNRGRELPPVVVTVTCPKDISYQVYSNSALILPPTPDMSMPFNVLSLACSLYAYLIGTLATIMVKRASEKVYYKLYPDKKPKNKFQKLKEKVKSTFKRQHNSNDGDEKEEKKSGIQKATKNEKKSDTDESEEHKKER